MKFVLIQHTAESKPGVVLDWLHSRQIGYEHVNIHLGDSIPEAQEETRLIFCGGGVHAGQEDEYPWLRQEKKFLERSLKLGARVIGLCLGGQLCAEILGGRVAPHPIGWESGWFPVQLHATPNLKGFAHDLELHFSQFHREIFEAPKGSRIIASNEWWPAQAFEWNNQVLAFQFHPERNLEVNREIAKDSELPLGPRCQTAEDILKLGELHQAISAQWFFETLDGFLREQ
jgi:GMP synthase-like glutamine amidotransferase